MHATLPLLKDTDFPAIKRGPLEIVQVNLGHLCNQQCLHCHVNAGPTRKEIMSRETIEDVLTFVQKHRITTLDLTGGAPELNPHFRYLLSSASDMGVQIMDRCNLTVLNEPGQETLAEFLAQNKVEIFASLPCYLQENVDAQRGKGVYDGSIYGMKKLNEQGYAQPDSGLKLNLVYNPIGPSLSPPQQQLEQEYRRQLASRFDVQFNRLLTITNMPIKRFGSMLISKKQFDDYMQLLKGTHQDSNLETIMCRNLLSVDWQGYVYDCDFNQMLDLPLKMAGRSRIRLRELDAAKLEDNSIVIADHCYGCTAGQGSSCGGALS